LKDVVATEKYRMFYKGLIPNILGQCFLYCSVIAGHICHNLNMSYLSFFCFVGFSAIAHPFFVLSMRLLYGKSGGVLQNNVFSLYRSIKKTEGTAAFYRGFLPSLIIYFFMFQKEYLMLFGIVTKTEKSKQVLKF
jgi:hypothetical protein